MCDNVGKWFAEEEKKLTEVVYRLSGASPGSFIIVQYTPCISCLMLITNIESAIVFLLAQNTDCTLLGVCFMSLKFVMWQRMVFEI